MKQMLGLVFALCLASNMGLAASNINVTGAVDAAAYYDDSGALANSITGNSGTADTAATTSDLTCTNCIGGTEVDESSLSGTATSLTVGDISCTDCLSQIQIADVFINNTGSSGTGTYDFNAGDVYIDAATGYVGFSTTAPLSTLHVGTGMSLFSSNVYFIMEETDQFFSSGLWRFANEGGEFSLEQSTTVLRDFSTLDAPFSLPGLNGVFLGGGSKNSDAALTMHVSPSKRVGIGRTNPVHELHIEDATADTGIMFDHADGKWTLGTDASTSLFTLAFGNTLGINTSIVFSSSEQIGIKTNEVDAELYINGSFAQTPGVEPHNVSHLIDGTLLLATFELEVQGKYAYVNARGNDRLVIIDIHDPTDPFIVGSLADSTYLDNNIALDVVGRYVYVAATNDDMLTIIDVSDPSNPYKVGNVTHPSLDAVDTVFVDGSFAYLGTQRGNFTVIDVMNPSAPRVVANFTHSSMGDQRDIVVNKDIAYVMDYDKNNVVLINVTDPNRPSFISNITHSDLTNSFGIDIKDNYLYAGGYSASKIVIINVSDPSSPAIIASTGVGGAPWDIEVTGKYAYLSLADGMAVVDIEDPTNPRLLYDYNNPTLLTASRGISVSGRYAYLTSLTNNTFVVIDLGGLDTHAASFGHVSAGAVKGDGRTMVGNNLYVGGSALVGGAGTFVQGRLHVAGPKKGIRPTMYLTTTTFTSDHDCDDNPANCCDSGYHMCTAPELLSGGREIEATGKDDREADYDGISGYVDPVANDANVDCSDWTATATNQFACTFGTSGVSCGVKGCSGSSPVWCCSD